MPCRCLRLRRRPAVSISWNVRPSRSITVSIASRVVPGTSETIVRSDADELVVERRLADVRAAEDRDADRVLADRLPRRLAREQVDDLVEQVAGVRAVQRRERERLAEAEPVELERERLLRRVVDLVREHEHGFFASRRICASSSSPGVTPARASTTKRTRSASSIAARACSAICRVIGLGSAMSTPPVSISRKLLAVPLADELLAVARRALRLVHDGCAGRGQPVDSVDLPTFGKPTIATVPSSLTAVVSLTAAASRRPGGPARVDLGEPVEEHVDAPLDLGASPPCSRARPSAAPRSATARRPRSSTGAKLPSFQNCVP